MPSKNNPKSADCGRFFQNSKLTKHRSVKEGETVYIRRCRDCLMGAGAPDGLRPPQVTDFTRKGESGLIYPASYVHPQRKWRK